MNAEKSPNKSGTRLNEIVLSVSLNLIWILMALLAVWLGWRSYTLSTTGSVAEGTVVRLLEDDKAAFDSDFTPIVEFQADGKTYTVQSQNSYRWWDRYLRFWVGGHVKMLYDPAQPERAEINSWLDIWLEPILLGIFSIIAALAINAYLRYRWRSRRATQIAS